MAMKRKTSDEWDQEKMFRTIAKAIIAGNLPVDRALPTYKELADLYEVGLGTVSRVMFALRMCGFVRGWKGECTFVSDEWRRPFEERFEKKNI